MRSKLFLLALCFSVFLCSCKKDNSNNNNSTPLSLAEVKKAIIGTWVSQKLNTVSLDASGKVVSDQTTDNNGSHKDKYVDEKNMINLINDQPFTYTLTEENGQIIMHDSVGGVNIIKMVNGLLYSTWEVPQTSASSSVKTLRFTVEFRRL